MPTATQSPPRYRWKLLRAGPFRLDGGSMFGVVPRVVWSRTVQPDEQHRILLALNCLLLEPVPTAPGSTNPLRHILIETGSSDLCDAKTRSIFGLTDRTVETALCEIGVKDDDVDHVIVSHLHFDHGGGLVRRARPGERPDWVDPDEGISVKRTFPNARIIVQRQEWQDACDGRSHMTRTYRRDHLEPVADQLQLIDSPRPFRIGHQPQRNEAPQLALAERITPVLPGIDVFLIPGHTWGQQAIRFTDDRGRTVVFTADLLPTVHHVGAAYNMAYDIEPFTSTVMRTWLLRTALESDWLLVLDHEPGNPCRKVVAEKNWYRLDEA